MSEPALLLLDGPDPGVGTLIDSTAGIAPEVIDISALAARLAGRRVHVLVSGLEVSAFRVRLPRAGAAKLRAMIPFALEDMVAADVDDLHFAVAAKSVNGWSAVLVVARARMHQWCQSLSEHGVVPAAFSVDYLALPWREGEWSIVAMPDRILLRTGAATGMAIERDNLLAMLHAALVEAGDERPAGITVYPVDDVEDPFDAAVKAFPGMPVRRASGASAGHDHLRMHAADGVDLRQGDFAPRQRWRRVWKQWRLVAGLAIVWLAGQVALDIVGTRALAQEKQRLDGDITRLYREAFPRAKKVVNARAQMQNGLNELRAAQTAGNGFLELLSAGLPALRGAGISVQRLIYRTGRLEVEIEGNNVAELERLNKQVAAPDVRLEVLSATARDGKVRGRIQLKARGDAS